MQEVRFQQLSRFLSEQSVRAAEWFLYFCTADLSWQFYYIITGCGLLK